MRPLIAAASVFLILSATGPKAEAGSPEQIDAAIARIDAAGRQLAAAGRTTDQKAALASAIAAYEDGLAALRSGLRSGSQEREILRTLLVSEEQDSGRMVSMLERLGGLPTESRLGHPGGPLAMVQSEIILVSVVRELDARANLLRNRIQEISKLTRQQEQAVGVLRAGMLAASRGKKLLEPGDKAGAAAIRTKLAIAALRQGKDSLAALSQLISSSESANSSATADTAAKLPSPVKGRVLRAYDTEDAGGFRRPGVVMAAAPGSAVMAPAAATVRFAGDFPGYDQVVVLEIRPGYLVVLAGMAAALVTEGENVPAGETVGLLGGGKTSDEEKLIAGPKGTGGFGAETLYIEARHNGEPVDPTGWLDLPVQ